MKARDSFFQVVLLLLFTVTPLVASAQGTQTDYELANSIREKYQSAAINIPGRANWIGKTSRFWYRRSARGGNEFMLVDAESLAQRPAFDHERLAASLSAEFKRIDTLFNYLRKLERADLKKAVATASPDPQLIELMHQRLLPVDMFIVFEGGDHHRTMMEVGRFDDHGVEFVSHAVKGSQHFRQQTRFRLQVISSLEVLPRTTQNHDLRARVARWLEQHWVHVDARRAIQDAQG